MTNTDQTPSTKTGTCSPNIPGDITPHRNRNTLFIALSSLREQHLSALRRTKQGQEAQIPTSMSQILSSSYIPAFLRTNRVHYTPDKNYQQIRRVFAKTNMADVCGGSARRFCSINTLQTEWRTYKSCTPLLSRLLRQNHASRPQRILAGTHRSRKIIPRFVHALICTDIPTLKTNMEQLCKRS